MLGFKSKSISQSFFGCVFDITRTMEISWSMNWIRVLLKAITKNESRAVKSISQDLTVKSCGETKKTYSHIIPRHSSLSASVHSKISYFSGHFIFLKLKLTDIILVVTSDLENIQNVVLRLSRLNEIVTPFMLTISPVDGQTFVRHGPGILSYSTARNWVPADDRFWEKGKFGHDHEGKI